ncbi:hypothetical protein HN419_01115 [Candidatus Woesearchaeota archaeon]|jgi:hypothetical protein|nr:hypothetical protein [Candidatus Woesearchaeota archaeon]MBT3537404.1 hypothetical protein [Candidatus Woesearchaeota archaeon]MBT4697071.1 hypothetical protein [Candidatus Woesearchaeota archaeon]MBT4717518.1 hypothetical protein [Candidatus Woesearchaeota archaeon]MBT7106286.1 hypothetical protein [Candidatus Woesearchaeota archaeon]
MTKQKSVRNYLPVIAFAITLFLFLSVIIIGNILNNERQDFVAEEMQKMYSDFNSMQTLSLIMGDYDDEMVCIAFESKLQELDSYIWTLAEKIDKYRIVTEEFQEDEFYLKQKKTFNENEIFYYLMMRKMNRQCNMSKEPLLFFYQNSFDCKKCDDQSFVLTDINEDDDDLENEVAIFSLDVDLNISAVDMMTKYYELEEYPCLIFSDGTRMCGMMDKFIIERKLCEINPKLMICE